MIRFGMFLDLLGPLPYGMVLECRVENSLALAARTPSHFHIFWFVCKPLDLEFPPFGGTDLLHMDPYYVRDNIDLLLANTTDFWDSDTQPEIRIFIIYYLSRWR